SLTTSQHEAFIILPPRESSRTPSERVLNPKPSGNATRRARALRGVWRRCSLLTDRCGYARHSRLASRHELLLRGLLLFMRWLLIFSANQTAICKRASIRPERCTCGEGDRSGLGSHSGRYPIQA